MIYKIFYLLLIYNFAFANNYELKLYEKVLPSIFKEIPIKVFADKDTHVLLEHSNKFHIVSKCDKAVILLIGKRFDNIPIQCKDKPIFATSYRSYKNSVNSFGAFYWRKGRPQLKFKNEVLEKYNLNLPFSLQKYVK